MKIKFRCQRCNEEFNISTSFLLKKESVICPNCSMKFNEELFPLLREGIKKINECKEDIESNDNRMEFKIID